MKEYTILLLFVAILGASFQIRKIPLWLVPTLCLILAFATSATRLSELTSTLKLFATPLGFLLSVVPLAVLLDKLGYFKEIGNIISRRKNVEGGLWILACATVITCNLDAAVVLLTPLYVHIAKERNIDVVSLAIQPALAATLASPFLPVSNLTNLIAVAHSHTPIGDYLIHMVPPSLLACLVGWLFYKFKVGKSQSTLSQNLIINTKVIKIGTFAITILLLGFIFGPIFHIEPYVTAIVVALFLVGITRSIPLKAIPFGTALMALSLGVLATSVFSNLDLVSLFNPTSPLGVTRTIGVSALSANLINNLPATLLGVHSLPNYPTNGMWAMLIGVDMGPVFLVIGSLHCLLWQSVMKALGYKVENSTYPKWAISCSLPGMLAASALLVLITQ